MSLLPGSAIPSDGYSVNNSLRFRQSATANLTKTFPGAGNTKVMTWSCWAKRGILGVAYNDIFSSGASGGSGDEIGWKLDAFHMQSPSTASFLTTALYRDPSAWYHLVVAMDTSQATSTNRLKVYVNGVQITSFASITYPTLNAVSTLFNTTTQQMIGAGYNANGGSLDGYLAEINFIDGQQLTPSSFGQTDAVTGSWVAKKYTGAYGINGYYLPFTDTSVNTQNIIEYSEDATNAAWTKAAITATANTTTAPNGATTADSILETATTGLHTLLPTASRAVTASTVYTASVYVRSINNQYVQLVLDDTGTINGGYANYDLTNGTVTQSGNYGAATGLATSITSVGSGWYRITLSTTIGANTTARYAINGSQSGTSGTFPNYLGNVSNGYYVWGMQLNQGSTVSPYIYTAGTAQSTAVNNLGRDYSLSTGGYNSWIPNNISVTAGVTYDAMTDSPTLTSATVANYCTLNPATTLLGAGATLSNGNLRFTPSNTNWMRSFGTISVSSGKWYWEVTGNSSHEQMHGILLDTAVQGYAGSTNWVGFASDGYGYYSAGTKWTSNHGVSYGASYTTGDVIGVALDLDAGTLIFYKNNVSQGTAFTGLSGNFVPAVSATTNVGANSCDVNFGQQGFKYTPPSGYKALNTFNLPDSTIKKGNTVMDATIWSGNSVWPRSITNAASFRPDLVWMKNRSNQANWNALFDSIRGVNNTLFSNATNAEGSNDTAGWLSAFNSNGFSVINGSVSGNNNNTTGNNYVAWQWQAGQGSTSSNTSGTITSTVSANPTAGFSIVTYTGTGATATVGHGLGVAPKMVITKKRSSAGDNWVIWHTSLTSGTFILVFTTAAQFSSTQYTAVPSSTVLNLNTATGVNNSGSTYVSYCWAEIAGFSKFGSYTGNLLTDGPFVYTGFRPKFVLIKNASATGSWYLYDSARNTSNLTNLKLSPNLFNVEGTQTTANEPLDLLSNGFKLRGSGTEGNGSGNQIIYAAFAENPFKYANAR